MRKPRSRLVVNPTIQLTIVADVSRRGTGRRKIEVTDPRLVRFLVSTLAVDGTTSRLDGARRSRLVEDGILVRPAEIPCDVHLDPRLGIEPSPGERDARLPHTTRLALSTGSQLHGGPGLLPGVAGRAFVAEPFLPKEQILWVRRRGSRIALPYTLTPALIDMVRGHVRGCRKPLPPPAIAALRRVGAIEGPQEAAGQRARWRGQVRAWRRELRTRRYTALRGLFTAIFLAAVREYYRRLESEGYLLSSDHRCPGSPVVYDEPVLSFLGAQLASVVGQVTGERTPYRFSYLRVHQPGEVLASHRDIPLCRWNLDLVVGGEPAPERRSAWPLWIDGRDGPRPIRLALGDALLYRGATVRHWRRTQSPSRTTVLASLHYG